MIKSLIYILLFLLLPTASSCISPSTRNGGPKYFTVTKVVDGDTFWVDDGSEKGLKIRFIGIDTPETRKTKNKEIEYYAQESKEYLTQLILGKKLRLEYDVDSLDWYGRTLAYVYLLDNTFVNALLVEQGYAMVMTVPPNVKFAEMFVKLQREARENNRGLWGKQEIQ